MVGAPSGETQLLEYTKALERHTKGRHALHMKLCLLSSENSGSFANRNTASFFHALIKAEQGKLFRLSNGDMIFVGSTATKTDIDALHAKVTKFFGRDSHIADDPHQLIDGFDLGEDFKGFLAACEALKSNADAGGVPLTSGGSSDAFTKAADAAGGNVRSLLERTVGENTVFQKPKKTNLPKRLLFEDEEIKPISPADLDRLESNFSILDPSNLLEDMPVAAVVGDMPPHVIFSEKSIDYDGLQAAVLPSRNLRGDANLFERLSCIIEHQLIKKLHLPPSGDTLANSFPSNIKTVLSGDFIQFDRNHRRSSNVPLIIDIRLHDALMHMSHFIKMRERVREAGYRICLSGMTAFGFCVMDHSHRMADFIKVNAPGPDDQLDAQWLEHFYDSARKAGQNRLIMSKIDAAEDLDEGRKLGFSLFQGSHINSLIADGQNSANAAAKAAS